jgi:hypothetical protein
MVQSAPSLTITPTYQASKNSTMLIEKKLKKIKKIDKRMHIDAAINQTWISSKVGHLDHPALGWWVR